MTSFLVLISSIRVVRFCSFVSLNLMSVLYKERCPLKRTISFSCQNETVGSIFNVVAFAPQLFDSEINFTAFCIAFFFKAQPHISCIPNNPIILILNECHI